MKKVRIATHESGVKALEESLLDAGVFHISEAENVLEHYSDFDTNVSETERETSNAVKSLDRVADKFGLDERAGITSVFIAPVVIPELITSNEEMKLVVEASTWISEIERELSAEEREIGELSAEIDEITEKLVLYREVGPDAPLLISSENLVIKVFECREGSFNRFSQDAEAEWMIAKAATVKRGVVFLVCIHREELRNLEEAVKKANLKELRLLPGEDFETLKKRLSDLGEKRKRLVSELWKRKEELKKEFRILRDLLNAQLERDAINSNLIEIDRITVIEGFIPEERLPELKKVEERCKGEVLIQSSDEWSDRETPPTALDNPKVFKPFEVLTHLYGTPRYREVDPTPFVAIFFLVFFGMMMGGVMRGLTLAAISGFIVWKGSRGARDLGIVFLLAGLFASVWGAITGDILGGAIGFAPPIFDTVNDPVGFILLSILLGVGQLLVGSGVGIYNNLREGKIKNALASQVSWILIFSGVASMLYISKDLGYALIALGFCLMVFLGGIMGLMGITEVVSNTVSYVRIVAIGLSGTMIMQTFVIIANLLLPVPVIGFVLYLTMIGLSHLFTIVITFFASFAHALRLNFIEFFGRFYEDGGVKYKPVKINRQFTQVKK